MKKSKDNYNVDAEHLSGSNGCEPGCVACFSNRQHTHTAIPWHNDGNLIIDEMGHNIATTANRHEGMAYNAAFIVRTGNNFYPMLKGLKMAVGRLSDIYVAHGINSDPVRDAIRDIIAKAEGKL
jgi:hypothetical protein